MKWNKEILGLGLDGEIIHNSEPLPIKVQNTIEIFEQRKTWFRLSRNQEATTCSDAATKRLRNEKQGIPLSDELKTFFAEYQLAKDKRGLMVINLPGNHFINFSKLRKLLNKKTFISPVNERMLSEWGIKFGEINPFLIDYLSRALPNPDHDIKFIFDPSIFSNRTESMMTNAGELTWGIEFRPKQLFLMFPEATFDQSIVK